MGDSLCGLVQYRKITTFYRWRSCIITYTEARDTRCGACRGAGEAARDVCAFSWIESDAWCPRLTAAMTLL